MRDGRHYLFFLLECFFLISRSRNAFSYMAVWPNNTATNAQNINFNIREDIVSLYRQVVERSVIYSRYFAKVCEVSRTKNKGPLDGAFCCWIFHSEELRRTYTCGTIGAMPRALRMGIIPIPLTTLSIMVARGEKLIGCGDGGPNGLGNIVAPRPIRGTALMLGSSSCSTMTKPCAECLHTFVKQH